MNRLSPSRAPDQVRAGLPGQARAGPPHQARPGGRPENSFNMFVSSLKDYLLRYP